MHSARCESLEIRETGLGRDYSCDSAYTLSSERRACSALELHHVNVDCSVQEKRRAKHESAGGNKVDERLCSLHDWQMHLWKKFFWTSVATSKCRPKLTYTVEV